MKYLEDNFEQLLDDSTNIFKRYSFPRGILNGQEDFFSWFSPISKSNFLVIIVFKAMHLSWISTNPFEEQDVHSQMLSWKLYLDSYSFYIYYIVFPILKAVFQWVLKLQERTKTHLAIWKIPEILLITLLFRFSWTIMHFLIISFKLIWAYSQNFWVLSNLNRWRFLADILIW